MTSTPVAAPAFPASTSAAAAADAPSPVAPASPAPSLAAPDVLASMAVVADAIASVRLPAWAGVVDADLLALQRAAADIRRRADALVVQVAGEITRRSAREAGYAGLAQRLGARTPERLLQTLTGVTSAEARQLVAVSRLADTSVLGAGVREGAVSVAQAAAVASELAGATVASSPMPAERFEADAAALLADADSLSVAELRSRAREVRDRFDATSVVERERELHERRYLRLIPLEDGLTRITGLLDPESAALVVGVVDAGTSPRRGGPRFTTPTGATHAATLDTDPRTTEQLALDVLVEVLRAGTTVDPTVIGPPGNPVQLLIVDPPAGAKDPAASLERPRGSTASTAPSASAALVATLDPSIGPAKTTVPVSVGWIAGQTVPISAATAERVACANGVAPIRFDPTGKRVLNLGRAQRLFTSVQRKVLAARDGGCRMPGCTAPPSRTEAHHIVQWSRGGPTDVDNGILLCRFHHLLIHNNDWHITRDHKGDYRITPPPDIDPHQRAIPMPTKNPLLAWRSTA